MGGRGAIFPTLSALAGGTGITVSPSRPLQPGGHARNSDRILRTAIDPSRLEDPKDQQRFAYPVYVVFLMAPTIKLTFPQAQTCFRVAFIALTLISVPLWLKTVRWRPSFTVISILVILTFGSFGVVQGIKLQQLSLVVNGIMAASAAALVSGQFAVAGSCWPLGPSSRS